MKVKSKINKSDNNGECQVALCDTSARRRGRGEKASPNVWGLLFEKHASRKAEISLFKNNNQIAQNTSQKAN